MTGCPIPPNESPLSSITLNLLLLLGSGLFASVWILYYTEWFPVFLGLLGLGGVFAWLAFLGNLLREERKKQLQGWFDQRVLQSGRLRRLLGAGLGAAMVASLFVGTVRLKSLEDKNRVVYLRPASVTDPIKISRSKAGILAARQKMKFIRWTLPCGRTYQVKASGLPSVRMQLLPVWRKTLSVPDDFLLRPVVLVRPQAGVSAGARAREYVLEVRVDGHQLEEPVKYRGESVWVGWEEDVEIPELILDRWKLELVSEEADPGMINFFQRPLGVATGYELKPGSQVSVRVLWAKNRSATYARTPAPVEIKPRLDALELPQVAILEPAVPAVVK